MKILKSKTGTILSLIAIAIIVISCAGDSGSDDSNKANSGCNSNNGECSAQYFEDTPFEDLDDFVGQIEQFKTNQLVVYNDDIDNLLLFGNTAMFPASTTNSSAVSPQLISNGNDFLLDFQDFYLMENDYSVICVYKFLETTNTNNEDDYQVKGGTLLSRYVYSDEIGDWQYSGESQVYSYDYLSQDINGHRIITATYSIEENLADSETQLIESKMVTPQVSSLNTLGVPEIQEFLNNNYVRRGIKYLRVLPDIIVQVDIFKKGTEIPAGTLDSCRDIADWRDVNHANLRIWARPRGDGSIEQTIGKGGILTNNKPLAPHLYVNWFQGYNKGKTKHPGYMISNWHFGLIKSKDGKYCFLLGDTQWRYLNNLYPGKTLVPDTLMKKYGSVKVFNSILKKYVMKYNCPKFCLKPSEFFRQIPWLPWGYNIPGEVLNRLMQEFNNNAPKMIPVEDWLLIAFGSAITPGLISAVENMGPILYSYAQLAPSASQLSVAGTARLGSFVMGPPLIIIRMPFAEWLPAELQPQYCHPDIADENGCITEI